MSDNLHLYQLGITIIWALFVIALERKFPFDKQKFFRQGFWTDFVWYSIVQSVLLGFFISWLIQFLDARFPWTRLRFVSDWSIWTQFLFFFVVHDLYIYWFHRWQHNNAYLWRIHEAHHSVKHVDWVAGSRSHSIEILINQTIEFAPIVLLGGSPEVAVMKATLDAVWGMWIHSNIHVKSGWLQYIINGPEMHRIHHAIDTPWPGKNYATKLAFWDYWFGTVYRPKEKPMGYGIEEEYPDSKDEDERPRGFRGFWVLMGESCKVWLRQHVVLFRPFETNLKASTDESLDHKSLDHNFGL